MWYNSIILFIQEIPHLLLQRQGIFPKIYIYLTHASYTKTSSLWHVQVCLDCKTQPTMWLRKNWSKVCLKVLCHIILDYLRQITPTVESKYKKEKKIAIEIMLDISEPSVEQHTNVYLLNIRSGRCCTHIVSWLQVQSLICHMLLDVAEVHH